MVVSRDEVSGITTSEEGDKSLIFVIFHIKI